MDKCRYFVASLFICCFFLLFSCKNSPLQDKNFVEVAAPTQGIEDISGLFESTDLPSGEKQICPKFEMYDGEGAEIAVNEVDSNVNQGKDNPLHLFFTLANGNVEIYKSSSYVLKINYAQDGETNAFRAESKDGVFGFYCSQTKVDGDSSVAISYGKKFWTKSEICKQDARLKEALLSEYDTLQTIYESQTLSVIYDAISPLALPQDLFDMTKWQYDSRDKRYHRLINVRNADAPVDYELKGLSSEEENTLQASALFDQEGNIRVFSYKGENDTPVTIGSSFDDDEPASEQTSLGNSGVDIATVSELFDVENLQISNNFVLLHYNNDNTKSRQLVIFDKNSGEEIPANFVTWYSTQPDVISVDENGIVTAHKVQSRDREDPYQYIVTNRGVCETDSGIHHSTCVADINAPSGHKYYTPVMITAKIGDRFFACEAVSAQLDSIVFVSDKSFVLDIRYKPKDYKFNCDDCLEWSPNGVQWYQPRGGDYQNINGFYCYVFPAYARKTVASNSAKYDRYELYIKRNNHYTPFNPLFWKMKPSSQLQSIYCYGKLSALFAGDTKVHAPEACRGMFEGWENLVSAPEIDMIPSTEGVVDFLIDEFIEKILQGAYREMFKGCIRLEKAPNLDAIKIAGPYMFANMFEGCTSLEESPNLMVENAHEGAFSGMFKNCLSLYYPPQLNTNMTKVGPKCFQSMFEGCALLDEAPALPQLESIPNYAFEKMFAGCRRLPKAPKLTIQNPGVGACKEMYLNCAFIDDVSELTAEFSNSSPRVFERMFAGCEYLTKAPAFMLCELGEAACKGMFEGCSSLTDISGLSLIPSSSSEVFAGMFKGCSSLSKAPLNLNHFLAPSCYKSMFEDCTSLTEAPSLSFRVSNQGNCDSSFERMFANCISLVNLPEFVLPSLGQATCKEMFLNCSSLKAIENISAPNYVCRESFMGMFKDCTALETSPFSQLPAAKLDEKCYESMFENCTSLVTGPQIMATGYERKDTSKLPPDMCCSYMFKNCSSLKSIEDIHISSIDYFGYDVFYNCQALEKRPIITNTLPWYVESRLYRGCAFPVNEITTTKEFTFTPKFVYSMDKFKEELGLKLLCKLWCYDKFYSYVVGESYGFDSSCDADLIFVSSSDEDVADIEPSKTNPDELVLHANNEGSTTIVVKSAIKGVLYEIDINVGPLEKIIERVTPKEGRSKPRKYPNLVSDKVEQTKDFTFSTECLYKARELKNNLGLEFYHYRVDSWGELICEKLKDNIGLTFVSSSDEDVAAIEPLATNPNELVFHAKKEGTTTLTFKVLVGEVELTYNFELEVNLDED